MSTCILIPTSTLYYNIWEPHLKLLKIYWADCPLDIYIGSDLDEKLDYNLDKNLNINYIFTKLQPKKDNILTRLVYYLTELSKKYTNVLLLIDDMFLTRNVNNNDINECINLMNKNKDIGMIRLHPSPPAKKINQKYTIKYKGQFPNIEVGQKYRDPICSHCLDQLYIKKPLYLPHLEADLDDSKIKSFHIKKNYLHLANTNSSVLQPSLWNINFLITGLNNLIKNNYNDFREFEIHGSKFFRNKTKLAPKNRWDIIYPCRSFCGGGVFSGVISKWAIQLMKKNNIHLQLYNGNYIFDTIKIKSNHDKIGKGRVEYAEKINL